MTESDQYLSMLGYYFNGIRYFLFFHFYHVPFIFRTTLLHHYCHGGQNLNGGGEDGSGHVYGDRFDIV